MILGDLTQWRHYAALSPRFQTAFEFLNQLDDNMPLGRVDIAGEEIYALVMTYTTKDAKKPQFEAHRKYIDIQFIRRGRETIFWAPLPSLTKVQMAYQEEKDAALFAPVDTATPLHLSNGQFAVFFPEDGHLPSCPWGEPSEVFKVVVKVRV